MPEPTLESLQKQLAQALTKITSLEDRLENMRKRTNVTVNGHSAVLIRLIGHTKCPPPQGTEFHLILNTDVGG